MLERLSVDNTRVHQHFELELTDVVTTIIGKNGAGKTTLLEAISYLCRGKSFRGSDRELLRHGAEWFKITGVIDGQAREIRFQSDHTPSKTIIVDGKTSTRMPRALIIPLVVFEPDDLRLIHGSPARRRRWCDTVTDTLHPGHLARVRRYERVVLQRNAALRTRQELFAWDVALSNLAEQIIAARRTTIDAITPLIAAEYQRISRTQTEVDVHYHMPHQSRLTTASAILELLQRHHARDHATGVTSVGPHRDDITFRLRGQSAASTASRGETRTIIIAGKHAEAQLVRQELGKAPIILLDDVLSELDHERQAALEAGFGGFQTVLTAVGSTQGAAVRLA